MFIIQKGIERVNIVDKDSADTLMFLLTKMGCTDTLAKRNIVGGKSTEQAYTVTTDKDEIWVSGQDSAELVAHWLLTLGCKEVSITRTGE